MLVRVPLLREALLPGRVAPQLQLLPGSLLSVHRGAVYVGDQHSRLTGPHRFHEPCLGKLRRN